jgi:ATP-dependent RNA helicase SUPV3L1/SUV3
VVIADEHLAGPDKEKVRERLSAWLTELIGERLKPLVEINAAQDISGFARGIAFRLKENFGVLRRESVAEEIRSPRSAGAGPAAQYGVRFGVQHLLPDHAEAGLLELAAVLWILARDGARARHRRHARAAATELTSLPSTPPRRISSTAWPAIMCAVRARCGWICWSGLADLIRALLTWRPDPANPGTPQRCDGDGGFHDDRK